ncbi:hypothetical protein AKJ16_DCAP14608 [Drosera capensis]
MILLKRLLPSGSGETLKLHQQDCYPPRREETSLGKGKIMSYWAGKGVDQHATQLKTTQPTGATAPSTERIRRAPESYGGNGVDSPVVGGKGQTTEDNRFNRKAVQEEGKASAEQHAQHNRPTQPARATAPSVERIQQAPEAYGGDRAYSPTVGARVQLSADNGLHGKPVEQERKANAINQVIQAPGNKPAPAPAAPAQPTVPRMHRTPSREPMQVSSTAETVVQTDSASGKPLVSGSSQNRPPADLSRTMSRTEAAPRNDLGGTIVGYIVVPNHMMQVPRSINQPAGQTDMESTVAAPWNQREAQESLGSRRMKTNDVQPRQQESVLQFNEQNTSNNAYHGVSSQASIKDTTIGAPPTGQAAANHNSHQQSSSRSQDNSKSCSCCVM